MKKRVKKDKNFNQIYAKAKRLFIISIIGLIFAVGAIVFDIYYRTGVLNYILDALLFVFCAFFIYKTRKLMQYGSAQQ